MDDTTIDGAMVVYPIYHDIDRVNIESLSSGSSPIDTGPLKFQRTVDEYADF